MKKLNLSLSRESGIELRVLITVDVLPIPYPFGIAFRVTVNMYEYPVHPLGARTHIECELIKVVLAGKCNYGFIERTERQAAD